MFLLQDQIVLAEVVVPVFETGAAETHAELEFSRSRRQSQAEGEGVVEDGDAVRGRAVGDVSAEGVFLGFPVVGSHSHEYLLVEGEVSHLDGADHRQLGLLHYHVLEGYVACVEAASEVEVVRRGLLEGQLPRLGGGVAGAPGHLREELETPPRRHVRRFRHGSHLKREGEAGERVCPGENPPVDLPARGEIRGRPRRPPVSCSCSDSAGRGRRT